MLRATAAALKAMRASIDRVSANEITAAVLRDPSMTLRVILYLKAHRARSQTADITTIGHALMMLGLNRFFDEFANLPVLEDALARSPERLAAAQAVISRGRHAALYARDWALVRHDLDPEEVMVAALLHDLPELVLHCSVGGDNVDAEAWRQSGLQQMTVLLRARWPLPALLAELIDERRAGQPRVAIVALACRYAKHTERGDPDALGEADLDQARRVLHISAAELWLRVRRTALAAAREWNCYGVRPAAYYWPMPRNLPSEMPQ